MDDLSCKPRRAASAERKIVAHLCYAGHGAYGDASVKTFQIRIKVSDLQGGAVPDRSGAYRSLVYYAALRKLSINLVLKSSRALKRDVVAPA